MNVLYLAVVLYTAGVCLIGIGIGLILGRKNATPPKRDERGRFIGSK